jgi:hypothetical protein
MLTNAQAGAGGIEQAQPTTGEAKSGARSAEGPTPAAVGGMGPTGLCRDTGRLWFLDLHEFVAHRRADCAGYENAGASAEGYEPVGFVECAECR